MILLLSGVIERDPEFDPGTAASTVKCTIKELRPLMQSKLTESKFSDYYLLIGCLVDRLVFTRGSSDFLTLLNFHR